MKDIPVYLTMFVVGMTWKDTGLKNEHRSDDDREVYSD